MRTFVAVPLPDSFVSWLDYFKALDSALNESVRFVPAASCHITVRFLGDVSDDRVQELSAKLSQALVETSATGITLDTIGVFHRNGRPGILWFGPRRVSRGLLTVAKLVGQAVAGFAQTKRVEQFAPHVTIGRFTRFCSQDELAKISALKIAPFTVAVQEIVVFESILGQGQPVYVRRSEMKLRSLPNGETELY